MKIYLDLGFHPHSDHFLTKEQLNEPEEFYPLRVLICLNCGLHQLDYVVPPQKLYQEDYLYESSITETGKKHYFEMAADICKRLDILKDSLAIDVGSNVGVLLMGFRNQGMRILGVDPAPKIAKIANENGVETVADFFSKKIAEKIVKEKGKASVVTGTNVFAHIDDWDDLLEGLKSLLKDDGVFVFESPYLVDLIENLEYDTVYHQHLSYLSIKPLVAFFKRYDMEIFDIVRSKIHGGSIRVFIGRIGKRKVQPIVKELVDLEEKEQVYSLKRLEKFAKDVEQHRFELMSLLIDLKKKNKRIVGIGAPAKGNTMLNYCGINKNIFEYLTEKSTLKVGRFSPGMHIPVYPDEKLLEDKPDYGLILPWNFAPEIMKNLGKFKENKGKFIIPIPTPKVVE